MPVPPAVSWKRTASKSTPADMRLTSRSLARWYTITCNSPAVSSLQLRLVSAVDKGCCSI